MMKFVFERQIIHLVAAVIMLVAVYALSDLTGFDNGAFLGVSTVLWAALALADAIIHQVYVWLCWRAELQWHSLTRMFGEKAFTVYSVGFTILIALRPILIFALAWSNRGTLNIDPLIGYGISALLLLPTAYLMYSIVHYFSFRRAFGIDHFEPNFGTEPMVRDGIFRWSPNAMYVFGFLGLWIPAFLFQSMTALVIAAFSHAYIWVHYYATEKPDMTRIYG